MLLLAAFGLADKRIFSHLLSARRRARPFQEITEQRKWCSSLPPRCPAELQAAFPTAGLQPEGGHGAVKAAGAALGANKAAPPRCATPAGQPPVPNPHLLVQGIAADPVPLRPGVRRQGEHAGEAGVDQLRAVGVTEMGLQRAAPQVKERHRVLQRGKAAPGVLT